MDSHQPHSLLALLVFKHTLNFELVRSLHVYRLEDGKQREVEREFLFSEDGCYVEMAASPVLRLRNFCHSEVSEGRVIGPWVCFFAFGPHRLPILDGIPPILMISRNPKLETVPAMAKDLQIIFELGRELEITQPSQFPSKEIVEENTDNQLRRTLFMFDLNCPPCPVATPEISENQENNDVGNQEYSAEENHENNGEDSQENSEEENQEKNEEENREKNEEQSQKENEAGNQENNEERPGITTRKRRAPSDHIAKIALEDLAKNFDFPMVEASRNLKIGLTVLKRKCREFGIPRWPHRKIKSLDGLIHDLQEEADRQQENKAAAMAVLKRQRMLETEKESIERKPFIELEDETKRFRQDVFKRRHRARALKNRR